MHCHNPSSCPRAKASVSAGLTTRTWLLALLAALWKSKQSPCALHVLHRGNALQQCAVIVQDANEMTCHKVCVTQRCSEFFDALLIGGQTTTFPHMLSTS